MLIIALVLAAIGLAALVFAVVTSNALVAWVCIGASLLGVLLLIADALRERRANQAVATGETADESVSSEVPTELGTAEDAEDASVFVETYEADDTYEAVDAQVSEATEAADVPVVDDDDAAAHDAVVAEADPAEHPAD